MIKNSGITTLIANEKIGASLTKRSVIWSTALGLITLLIGSGLSWWFGYPEKLLTAVLVTLSSSLFVALVTYRLIKQLSCKKTIDTETILVQKRAKFLAQNFKRMLFSQRRKKRLGSIYDLPVYFLLSQAPQKDKNIITQMGYEAFKVDDFGNGIEFPVLFWLSEHSILISISTSDDQQPLYLKTLTSCLNKWRPRQAINGILVATEVSTLLGNVDEVNQYADDIKSKIKTFNEHFGLDLPIYNIVTEMGQINDFCQFFSAFDDSKRNEVFGATSPVLKTGGIDAEWFNQEFDHLINQLIAHINAALSAQLNQDYRSSICAAPYQFGLLKQVLWSFLQRLYKGDQLNNGLGFRGFYFTHSGHSEKQYDLLANVVNESLGNDKFHQHQQLPVSQTLFAQHIMHQVVLNESQLVGVNQRKENMLLFWQGAYTFVCITLLISVLSIIKLDFDYQSERETKADDMLDKYKEAISATPYDIENMGENIPNLYTLNRIYNLYKQPEPWYTLPFLPSSSIKPEVIKAYFDDLDRVLIPSMENTLEKDLFVYVNLEDQAKTLSLLNNYRLLFEPERTNIDKLKTYFMSTLKEQGEADSVTLAQLKILLDDVFTKDLVPNKENFDLEKLARKVIDQTGIETLLYEHILNSEKYSKRIDIRRELGDKFNRIFTFSGDYIGYLVPYLYTPTGFNELDLSANSPVLKEALQAYEGIAGQSPSASELHRISKDLKKMYQKDYINYWRSFVSHINAKDITETDTLKLALATLKIKSDNPIARLYETIHKYTSVEIEISDSEVNKEAPPKQDPEKKEAARQIFIAFSKFHKQISTDENGSRPVDSLIKKIDDVDTWLNRFYDAENPQELAFKTLSAELKAPNPVVSLVSKKSIAPLVSTTILEGMTKQINEIILSLAHSYLNTAWQTEVFSPYTKTIAAYYPFNKTASIDASTSDITAFFKTGGTLDKFYQTKLKAFSTQERSPFLAGLVPNSGLALSPDVWQMINKAEDIRSALFLNDPQSLSIKFQVRAKEMSADLIKFSINADKSIFSYQHGPKLWSKQTWSTQKINKDSLDFRIETKKTSVSSNEYTGSWAWFKLIEPRVISSTSQTTVAEFTHGQSKVKIDILTEGQNNPFVPNFFSAFRLPASI